MAAWLERRFGAEVTWLPFDLHPEYPPEGMPRARLRERYGEEHDDRLRALFERHGLAFSPPDAMPNSRAALRMSELARDRGLHEQVHDRLMDALWSDGSNLGDPEVLRALAAETGLAANDVERVLAGDDLAERVRVSTSQAVSIGITGIPAFLLDDRLLVVGAHPREVFENAFARLG